MGPGMGVYQMFGWKGRTIGGMFDKPANMPGPAYWLPYAKVADSKRVAALTAKFGGKVLNGPMEVPGGDWITMGMDPQGAVFAVHSVAKPAAAPKPKAAKPKPTRKPTPERKPTPTRKHKPTRKPKPMRKPKSTRKPKPTRKPRPVLRKSSAKRKRR